MPLNAIPDINIFIFGFLDNQDGFIAQIGTSPLGIDPRWFLNHSS